MPVHANTSLPEIAEMMRTHQRFIVASHVRPDGDAIGSSLALALALQKMGKTVRVLSEDGIPQNLNFLPRARDLAGCPSGPADAEVAFALDTASQSRLGDGVMAALAATAPVLVNIDHHVSNDRYGRFHYIDTDAPATAEIVHALLVTCGVAMDREIAENLYTALSTDTGSFQYSSTSARTYRIAADLVECGIDVGDLNRRIYQSYPLRRVRLLGELLAVLRITGNGKCASWHVSREMAARAGAVPEDTENLIDHIRAIDGVVAAALFEELDDGRVRLSLRSKDPRFDASALCAKFGGGGHKMAAGARLAGPLASAQETALKAIHEALAAI